jgi:hypothetical protein
MSSLLLKRHNKPNTLGQAKAPLRSAFFRKLFAMLVENVTV